MKFALIVITKWNTLYNVKRGSLKTKSEVVTAALELMAEDEFMAARENGTNRPTKNLIEASKLWKSLASRIKPNHLQPCSSINWPHNWAQDEAIALVQTVSYHWQLKKIDWTRRAKSHPFRIFIFSNQVELMADKRTGGTNETSAVDRKSSHSSANKSEEKESDV